MSKQLICIPFAYVADMNTGVNVDPKSAFHTYMKNACVALCSAKHYNQECDVALITNLPITHVPNEYVDLLRKADIQIVTVPFDNFCFPKDYLWSLAFYKLCVLKYLTETEYAAVCYMDTDVFVQGSMNAVWRECEEKILLYDINHGLGTRDYQTICNEFETFTGNKTLCTHYGGEFFATNIDLAKQFCDECERIYLQIRERSFMTTKGDEFIISLAAENLKPKIKNAGAYVFRFWTGAGFRLVSTCYQNNRVTVLHVPDAKNNGMLTLYKKYISIGKIPDDVTCWKTLELSHISFYTGMKKIVKLMLKRVGVRR